MMKNRSYHLVLTMMVVLLAATACTADMGSEPDAVSLSQAIESSANENQGNVGAGVGSESGALSQLSPTEGATSVTTREQKGEDVEGSEATALASPSISANERATSQDPAGDAETGSEASVLSRPSASESTSAQVQDSEGHQALDGPQTLSEEEMALLPQVDSAPGAAGGDAGSGMKPEADDLMYSGAALEYTSVDYKFAVIYPAEFVVQSGPAGFLHTFNVAPSGSFSFMNPHTAASEDVQSEVADLEIRVYSLGQMSSLDEWLSSTNYLAGKVPQPFNTSYVSGLQVCESTMIAPGCDYFVLGNGWAYQLIPTTIAGEAMFDTFRLLP